MGTNLQKITDLILKSDISPTEQDNLINLFIESNDQDLEPILKLFSEDPSWINKINENYKSKQAAMTTGDATLWQKIVEEEESQLKELEQ